MKNLQGQSQMHSLTKSIAVKPLNVLRHFLQTGLLGALTTTTVLQVDALAHGTSNQHMHTKSAAFLRNCMNGSPASVASINSGCPNRQKGLVGIGSSVLRLQTVNRNLSGQKGIWYLVRVIQNQSSGQKASHNAQTGSVGWLRANKF